MNIALAIRLFQILHQNDSVGFPGNREMHFWSQCCKKPN